MRRLLNMDIAARFSCAVFALAVPAAAVRGLDTVAGAMFVGDWTSGILLIALGIAGFTILIDILVNSTTIIRGTIPWLAHHRWVLYAVTMFGLISALFSASRIIQVDISNGWFYFGGTTTLALVWLTDLGDSQGADDEKVG